MNGKIIFLVLIGFLSINALAEELAHAPYSGVEECTSKDNVHSVAHRQVGPVWEYTYLGRTFKVSVASLFSGEPSAVEHISEVITRFKCKGDETVYRESYRTIVLKEPNGEILVKSEMFCRGSFAWGVPGALPEDPCRSN